MTRDGPMSLSSSKAWSPLFLVLLGLGTAWSWFVLWMRECRVSSSEREKRFSQPGNEHKKGFSPVCVRIWRVCGTCAWVRNDGGNEALRTYLVL